MAENQQETKTINILILGETGVGKSTFINAFVNYLAYETLDEAEHGKLISLIPCSFTLTDENFEEKLVKFGEDENEDNTPGQSVTQNCRSYLFHLGDLSIRLIDTPGIGDTRGVEQDKLNFSNIMDYIGQYSELHCICILMRPNNARITVTFEFCIKQLLTNLQKSASKNIVFLFTNVRGTFYRPGDTAPALIKVLNQVKDSPPNVDIPFNKSTIYCLDNEAFRFLVAMEQGLHFEPHEIENFDKSWSVSAEECQRLIRYIIGGDGQKGLEPHRVRDTVSVNEARRQIKRLFDIMPILIKVMIFNMKEFREVNEELNKRSNNLEQLKKILHGKMNTYNADVENEIYQCQKHPDKNCRLEEVFVQGRGLSIIRKMLRWKCPVCQCGINEHKKVPEIKEIQRNLNDNIGEIKTMEQAKLEFEKTVDNIGKECQKMKDELNNAIVISCKLNKFLETNSISPYRDMFEHELTKIFDDENGKLDSKIKLNILEKYKNEKDNIDSTSIDIDSIFQMIEQISHFAGASKIKDVLSRQVSVLCQDLEFNLCDRSNKIFKNLSQTVETRL